MKTIALIACLISLPLCLAQAGEFVLVEEYKGVKGFVAQDKLGNIYSIENGVLLKNPHESDALSYSNRSFGNLSSVHVEDPLNIYVFFEDFGHVVLLDKNLAEKTILRAPELHDYDIAQKICFSVQDGFWAFFPNDTRIVRFNKRGIAEVQSAPLQTQFPRLNHISHMQESAERVWLSREGLWAFDLHGGFLFYLPEIKPVVFQVVGQKLFFIEGERLVIYDFFLREESVFLLPESPVSTFYVKGNEIFLQTDVSLKKFLYTGNFY